MPRPGKSSAFSIAWANSGKRLDPSGTPDGFVIYSGENQGRAMRHRDFAPRAHWSRRMFHSVPDAERRCGSSASRTTLAKTIALTSAQSAATRPGPSSSIGSISAGGRSMCETGRVGTRSSPIHRHSERGAQTSFASIQSLMK